MRKDTDPLSFSLVDQERSRFLHFHSLLTFRISATTNWSLEMNKHSGFAIQRLEVEEREREKKLYLKGARRQREDSFEMYGMASFLFSTRKHMGMEKRNTMENRTGISTSFQFLFSISACLRAIVRDDRPDVGPFLKFNGCSYSATHSLFLNSPAKGSEREALKKFQAA